MTVGPTTETWFPVVDRRRHGLCPERSADERLRRRLERRRPSSRPTPRAPGTSSTGGLPPRSTASRPSSTLATGDVILTVDATGLLRPLARRPVRPARRRGGGGVRRHESEFEVYDVDVRARPSPIAGTAVRLGLDRRRRPASRLDKNAGHAPATRRPATAPTAALRPAGIPEPEPVTETYRARSAPDGNEDCYFDNEFPQNCYDHPDECEWDESVSVSELTNELKLGGPHLRVLTDLSGRAGAGTGRCAPSRRRTAGRRRGPRRDTRRGSRRRRRAP